jgi:hypothetical protein
MWKTIGKAFCWTTVTVFTMVTFIIIIEILRTWINEETDDAKG